MKDVNKKIGMKRRRDLIGDIVEAKHDLVTLAVEHNLEPDDLAEWVADPINHRTLNGLCVLADMQTQVLLSRYRLLAANRLIKLATDEESGGSNDVARRACVDLLKLDLKRADISGMDQGAMEAVKKNVLTGVGGTDELREILYGKNSKNTTRSPK